MSDVGPGTITNEAKPEFFNLTKAANACLDPTIDRDIWDYPGRRYGFFLRVKDARKRFYARIKCNDGNMRDYYIADADYYSPKDAREIAEHFWLKYAPDAREILNGIRKFDHDGTLRPDWRAHLINTDRCLRCSGRRMNSGSLCRECEFRFRAERLERFREERLHETYKTLRKEIHNANKING